MAWRMHPAKRGAKRYSLLFAFVWINIMSRQTQRQAGDGKFDRQRDVYRRQDGSHERPADQSPENPTAAIRSEDEDFDVPPFEKEDRRVESPQAESD